jgi:hypothetical protein
MVPQRERINTAAGMQLLCSFRFNGSQYHNFHKVVQINMYKFIPANRMGLTIYQINLTPAVHVTKYQQMNKSLLLNLPFCWEF